jgi:phosphate transport system ATP-binding protein
MSIYEHEITAFIGSSGSGRTTELRAFNRMNDLVAGARMEGEIDYRGQSLYGQDVSPIPDRRSPIPDRRAPAHRHGLPEAEPVSQVHLRQRRLRAGPRINGIRNMSKLDEIVEHSVRQATLWDEVKNRLNISGLSLSGGQAQRLCIARTLAVEPDVVLMEEPASAPDPIATAAIEDLMQRSSPATPKVTPARACSSSTARPGRSSRTRAMNAPQAYVTGRIG